MICPHCNAANSEETPYCTNCGKALEEGEQSSERSVIIPRTSKLARLALILGIGGLVTFGVTAPFGLVLGWLAIRQINASDGRLIGGGMAYSAVKTSAIFTLLIPVFVMIFFPVFGKSRSSGRIQTCVDNQRQIAKMALMYAQDHQGTMPYSINQLQPYLPDPSGQCLICPAKQSAPVGYGVNSLIGAKKQTAHPETLLVSADGGTDMQSSLNSDKDIDRTRHEKTFIASFLDGHAAAVDSNAKVRLTP